MKILVKIADIALAVVCCIIFALVSFGEIYIPSSITFYGGTNETDFLEIYKIKESSDDIITVSSLENSFKSADVSLFGVIPVGKINAMSTDRKYVAVGGDIIGIRMYTEGLLVVGVEDVATQEGSVSPGRDCGITEGDIITQVNDEIVLSSNDFINAVNASKGDNISVTVDRNGKIYYYSLKPVYSEAEGKYRCGLWLRDSTAGIGTLTFTDVQTGMFACLGHAVCDSDTGAVLPVGEGDILTASVSGCTPGEKGTTGQIKGSFTNNVIGKLYDNNEFGVYGMLSGDIYTDGELYPVASQSEIRTGNAQIISTVTQDGKKTYDIEIEKITYSNEKTSRSMVIRVTDPELLELTGGIVQGMSGSPIIQDGMLVGAVTHVFLNDPEKGYAIFAETMLGEEERIFASVE